MTVKEIAEEHDVSRVSIHTYRRRGTFPKPIEGEGSTRLRFRSDEVAAFFAAHPKKPGKRTDLPAKQEEKPAVSTYRSSGLSREDHEATEQLHATANLIQERWPDAHPTLIRDLRDLADAITEESEAQDD
ncbi:helix-turn-helix domain-containing protein [Streptomyces griseoviridis]|uniref:helix-turn-helix transcriptional regulator n=1 Tax=Streptomyces griseoviridis TaxID=45398 RepID=UPI0033D71479